MSMYPLILICDDDPVVHESLGLYLGSEGYEHQSAYDGQQALEMVESLHPDMVGVCRAVHDIAHLVCGGADGRPCSQGDIVAVPQSFGNCDNAKTRPVGDLL